MRAAEGAEREAAADRLAAEATRAAARKQVEAISPRRPATVTAEWGVARWARRIEELGFGGGAMRCGGGGTTSCRIRMVLRFPWRRGMGVMGREPVMTGAVRPVKGSMWVGP